MGTALDKPHPIEPEPVSCEICLSEIPGTVAHHAEGPDYVHHYCGLACFAQWQACFDETGSETPA